MERIIEHCNEHMRLLREIDINNANTKTKEKAIYAMKKLTFMINTIVEDIGETMQTYHKIDTGLTEFEAKMNIQVDEVKRIEDKITNVEQCKATVKSMKA